MMLSPWRQMVSIVKTIECHHEKQQMCALKSTQSLGLTQCFLVSK